MNDFYNYISELNSVSITIRLALAALCGGIIGLERGRKGQAAGCRTHMLVCLGSALVMMTNIFVVNKFGVSTDPTRIGAQVVSGIGFLGAGTIIVTAKHQIRGLTTAAGLWASACMGLAIGVGFYQLAIIGNIFIFIIIAFFNKFEDAVYSKTRIMEIYMECSESYAIRNVIDYARKNDMEVKHIQVIKNRALDKSTTGTVFTLKAKYKYDHSAIITDLSDLDGVAYIEEM